MKELVRRLILLITIAATASVLPRKASATHLAGSDISYTCLGGNTYRVDLTFYRDCRGSAAPLGVGIEFRSASCNRYFTDTLLLVTGTGNEITYPCPTVVTSCDDPTSTVPGIQEYRYSGIINFPIRCADWVISWSYCCRNCDITTMQVASPCVEGANPGMYVAATLDNLNLGCNSSPRFTNIPVAFVCVGQNFTYNHGVVDPDGDSLVYSLVDPLVNATTSIPFLPGYSATNPISSSPALAINSANGDITMTPTQTEVGVVSVLIREYRNGVLIGSVVRDMQIYVRACNNNLPTVSGINGGLSRDTSICPGTNLCFDILSNDIDPSQILTMTWNQGIPGATFAVTGFPFPTGRFCWTPLLTDVRPNPYTFTVTVTDDACPNVGFQTFSFQVFVNSPLYNINTLNISCNNANDGSVSVLPGTGSLTYLWAPGGQTTSSISGLAAGNYTVTVTDTVTGCVGQSIATIVNPAVLTVAASQANASCAGSNSGVAVAIPAGGTPGYSFSWNTIPPTLNDTATNLAPGTYTVIVTDSRNCSTSSSVVINSSASAVNVVANSPTDLRCNGDSDGVATVSASGGTPSYTYSWNTVPPQNGPTATNLTAGLYIVTVTDMLGCIGIDSVEITEPSAISIDSSFTPSTCGLSDGSATAIASGGTPFSFGYQYLWNASGQTTATITGVGAGVYTVTVTDSSGCTESRPIIVSDNNISPPLDSVLQNVSCYNGDNGIAIVRPPVTGTGPFTFTWNTNPVQVNDTAFNLAAGIYVVGVTDVNGCSSFDTVQISQPDPIIPIITPNDGCRPDSSGSATISLVLGGTPNYSYEWQPYGGTNASATGLIPGTYTVLVTDANGCSGSGSVIIGQPNIISLLEDNIITPTCYGGSDGSIDISVSGGAGGYSYFWNPGGATTQDLSSIDAGIYVVTITDVNGCTVQESINLNQPPPLSPFAGNDTAVCAGNSIQLQATLGAGLSGQWTSSAGVFFVDPTSPTTVVNNLQSGFNNLVWTVTDANGCSGSGQVTVFNYVNVVVDAGSDTSFCGLGFVQLNANTSTGFSGIWSSAGLSTFDNPIVPNAVATLVDFGTDTLRWTITNGACVTNDYMLVTAIEPPSAEAGDYQLVCANDALLIARGSANGTGVWSVISGAANISDPSNDSTVVSALPVGNTLFLWSVSEGPCSASDTVSIDYDNACELELPTGLSPNGDGKNDGYHIRGIEGYPDNIFRVFNRWGNLVYDKEDYVNEDWIGQNNLNDQLPDGTYFVVLEVIGKNLRKSTYVDLRRQ